MHPHKILILLGSMAIFSGCTTTPPPTSGLIRFQPHEGDQHTVYVALLTNADRPPGPRFQPGPNLLYDPKFVGTIAKAVVDVSIDEAGNVTGTKLESATPDFVGAPVAALYLRAKFSPAERGGVPVACVVRVIESYRL